MNIIQIGANDGDDEVYELISSNRDKISKAVLIEPIPYCIPALQNRYAEIKNVYIENIAITNNPDIKEQTFYYINESNYQVSSLKKQHLTDHGVEDKLIRSISVNCLTISNIVDKYDIINLDYLFIDAEGYDYEIIKSIDFGKCNIKNIKFESMHIDGVHRKEQRYSDLVLFLGSMGYHVGEAQGLNTTAIKK
jgi:FkbM family methyltransferase